jgi:hypothetical protein
LDFGFVNFYLQFEDFAASAEHRRLFCGCSAQEERVAVVNQERCVAMVMYAVGCYGDFTNR